MINPFSKKSQVCRDKGKTTKIKKKSHWGKKPEKKLSPSKAEQLYKTPQIIEKNHIIYTQKDKKTLSDSKINQLKKNKIKTPKEKIKYSIDSSVLPNCKTEQTHKTKRHNPRIMNRIEYVEKCDWIFEKFPVCEICEEAKAEQIHHARYGYRQRDDRTIMGVCEPCHYQVHHGTKGIEKERLELEERGFDIHKLWNVEKKMGETL